MSRRRNAHRDTPTAPTERICATCEDEPVGHPDALHCDTCGDRFTGHLRSLLPTVNPDRYATGVDHVQAPDRCAYPRPLATEPGLWDTVLSVIVGERGIDYAALATAGRSGKGSAARKSTKITDPDDPMVGTTAVETGLVLNTAAVDAAHDLERLLAHTVGRAGSRGHRLRSTAPDGWRAGDGKPRRAEHLAPDLAAWLLWRADALLEHPEFTTVPGALDHAIERLLHVIDTRPRERLPYGPCDACTGGTLTAAPGRRIAWCDNCDTGAYTADVLDTALPAYFDRRMTIVDTVRLLRGYGIDDRPEKTLHALLRQWVRRDLVDVDDTGLPRFGDVFDRLTTTQEPA
ncbi:hypothetical protein GCM10022215_18180 [Nocardioides fonticola]|uniref:Uncharacterized protein n=1 Tax=Nocardioides fonticola TaxID=450363 RepID=A0ABP7XI22_9ACTN